MAYKYRTIYDRRISVSNPGSDMVADFVSVYDEDGKRKVVKSGYYSLYDEIQSYRESCDLKSILARYVQTGDESLLKRREAVFADVTLMPKTYAEMLQLSNAAENLFKALSPDKREIFNNNPDEFLASFGTDKFNEVMGIKENDNVIKDGSPTPTPSDNIGGLINE